VELLTKCKRIRRNFPEDALQDAYRIVWERRGRLAHLTSPQLEAYVVTTAIRESGGKQYKAWGSNLPPGMADAVPAGSAPEAAWYLDERVRNRLREIMGGDELTERELGVLGLRYVEGLGWKDVAEALGIHVDTVRSIDHRLRPRLRRLLEGEKLP
jgi:DNA-directed RNA polymerase specialized sigma24 family protein